MAAEFRRQYIHLHKMTSFIAWAGADSHGTSSMYFASDSRISWDAAGETIWDTGAKVFASRTQPEIFGYTGYVLLPFTALTQACSAIDEGLRSSQAEKSSEGKCDWLWQRIKSQTLAHPDNAAHSFTVLYGIRSGSKTYIKRKRKEPPVHSPEQPRAEFELFTLSWTASTKTFVHARFPVPHSGSSILKVSGTGGDFVNDAHEVWQQSPSKNTSRTMFAALCDALRSGTDPQSGGAPQLVGLYRKGNARAMGVVTRDGSFFQGVRFDDHPSTSVEWRDELFQRVDSTGRILDGAKLHDALKPGR